MLQKQNTHKSVALSKFL